MRENNTVPMVNPDRLPHKFNEQIELGAPFSLTPKSLREALEFAELIAKSNLVPAAFRGNPADILIVVQMGAEIGVAPMQALMNTAVINGRPCIWGDLGIALVQKSGKLEYLIEDWDQQREVSTVRIKRKGRPESVHTFSMGQARKIRYSERDRNGNVKQNIKCLADKDTYRDYPWRMCGWRAKTYAIRSEFADVLKGMAIAEEVMDFGPSQDIEAPAPCFRQPQMLLESAQEAKGETQPAEETTPDQVGALVEPAQTQENQQPGNDSAATFSSEEHEAPLTVRSAVEAKRGVSAAGKSYVLYKITFADGREATTFSESIFAAAQRAMNEDLPVLVSTAPGRKPGDLKIEDLSFA